ncbi:MAG: DUF2141 domain-containing protein [Desulfuromonadales bacterium]|nr:DUF2141 domain-containing protein [Desulfuromonadales bacterium]
MDNGAIFGWAVRSRSWPTVVSRLCQGLLLMLLAVACRGPAPTTAFPSGTGTLHVALEGFHNDRGTAIVSLFAGPKGFPDEVAASVSTVNVAIQEGKATVTFAGLPYGDYALSVLHDEDGDGQMATGLFGAPREGFGFSGYPDYRFGHPAYAEVSFLLVEPQREMTIVMRYETGRRQHQDEGRAAESRRPSQE